MSKEPGFAGQGSRSRMTWGKKAALVFIHVFVVLQLAAPLSYYTCRTDQNDERFAWRMFSPVRMLRCSTKLVVGEERQPVRLRGIFHEAWLTIASRGRREVIASMAKELCARARDGEIPGHAATQSPEVRAEVICRTVDGNEERAGGSWNLCEVDEL